MNPELRLQTPRLTLRTPRPADADAMAELNDDPETVRFANEPSPGTPGINIVDGMRVHWRTHGIGIWVVESNERTGSRSVVGCVGIKYGPGFLPSSADPRPELGWRIAAHYRRRGAATEAARAARDHACSVVARNDLWSIIDPSNIGSARVATNIGMELSSALYNPVIGRSVDVYELCPP
jgi:RimJ/RimL family protein N-acetyltransferase